MLLQTIVPPLWSMPSARMQSQARKLLRHMGLYLLRVQFFHHAPVQIQSMQRQSIHRVRHVEGMHMASDDQSIMMFPVPLHQRQEAASPFYMCHAVGQCWVLPPASSMCTSLTSHTACASTRFLWRPRLGKFARACLPDARWENFWEPQARMLPKRSLKLSDWKRNRDPKR